MADHHNGAPKSVGNHRLQALFGVPNSSSPAGKRLVIVSGVVLAVGTVLLYAVFRHWRTAYQERTRFAADEIVARLAVLETIQPVGVSDAAWKEAITTTQDMLKQVTSSPALNWNDLLRWRKLVTERIAGADQHNATRELADLWGDATREAAPLVIGLQVPALFRLANQINPLELTIPSGTPPTEWKEALSQTREVLLTLTTSIELTEAGQEALRKQIAEEVQGATVNIACKRLAVVWEMASSKLPKSAPVKPIPPVLTQCAP